MATISPRRRRDDFEEGRVYEYPQHLREAIEDADVLEVSTPHLDDVVRLQDSYGREGTNAP